ncbi:hypothetical protein QTP86_012195 [Hemibagrus guttatus]|nr:hypothetical protein QTP86_012195 [Hemibagrus guttatus]
MESIPTGERVVIEADFNGHVGEGNTGDEEVMGKFGVKERNLEGQMVVDFAKRMEMAVVNTYFQKREEHRVTYKSRGRSTQVDYILFRGGNLKEISDCKVVVGESVARQHRMVVCRMTLMVCKKKRSKLEIEKKTKWWKLKKEECCEEFRQKLRQALGGQVVLPDDWETTAEVIRETGRKVLGVSSGRKKEDKETRWWNEEVQDSIQRKRLAKKKWDMDRTEENRQEYKELQHRVKREESKAKQKAYDELYTRLDSREGKKDLYSTNFIPDRSRPVLTTTAIGAVDLQGAGGNWATVGRRSRGGRRVRRQREKRKGKSVGLRIGTLNVGTMTGKGRELADVMERRKVDILCVQETRWKGSKARSIGAGFKLFYYGVDSKRNGVGVVLKEEFVRNVLELKRVSDRVMSLKLEIEGVMLNVVSGYAPQVGCELEEKERFWSELDEVMESIPTGERVVIGADFNGHVGEGNTGDEEVMGKFGVKERNLEGQMVVDFAKRMDMGVVNTYFQKREEHRVTYKSGGRSTQVDYILCRRGNLKEISDCKVVVGESVARQHRMVVCRMTLMVCKKKRSEIEKKTKWWKLEKEECCEEFRQKLRQALGGQVVLPDDWETTAEVIRETGRKVLGVSSGRRKEDKETWWWNEEVQDSIQRKRLAKKKWDMDRTEENRQEYKELQRRVKTEVSKAKQKAYDELYTRLDTREGVKDLYRLARQRDRDGKDVQQVRVIKDRDGRVLTSEESVQRRWKEYFEELMNEENEREKRVEGVNSVEQKVDKIRKDKVRKALKRMKSGKAVGPDDIPVEVWKCLGEAAVEFLASLFNRVLESEKMPEEWRRSVLVPIFKNKGDVQSCSNYRGIKLMSHTMKVWERVVEARLRKVVEICEQQYGFMPRKSTTDAIFALRILMEKYRDGQRELHCVFVDLEKAYDRVPREELWYCMRKSGVAEKYVRVVQDMYERSRTVVRCAVGQTEEFNVEVGLHQGSALSPFLFAIVMDQLSEEVRQESPWTMMFADDIVICSESREQVEENLERWRFALERRGMKVSRSKTEYMCVNEREGGGTVRLQGEEVKKVQEFKYLGSTVQSNGECGKEQLIVIKLAQCQYALPLLVPNPFTREIEFPLWTFCQIRKSWKTTVLLEDTSAEISQTQAMSEAQTPMVAFFRRGSLSSSKSQLMNSLINEKHHTFFHRHCPESSKNRLLMDGVVEIAWFYPSGKETDYFSNCVAFCNLHGDAEANKEQLEILTEMSSVNVVLFSNSEKAAYKEILQKLYRDSKPLICLLSENESGVSVSKNGKYRIGLKDRNHSDVAKNLRTTIQECLSKSLSIFRVENLDKPEVITKDEDDHECKSGKEAAVKIMSLLKENEVYKLKEKFLPCQGKLWHDWCKMNKELHRIHGDNLENQKSKKQREMMEFRKDQHEYRLSRLMDQFACSLNRPVCCQCWEVHQRSLHAAGQSLRGDEERVEV